MSVFRDPVFLAESGRTFERESIEDHLGMRATNPLTSEQILVY